MAAGPNSEIADGLVQVENYQFGNSSFAAIVDTLHDVPWAGEGKYKIGSVICESNWLDGTRQEACPRSVNKEPEFWIESSVHIYLRTAGGF